jgi:hypothetical protein
MNSLPQPSEDGKVLPTSIAPILANSGQMLIDNGYEAIPLYPGNKRPIGDDWQELPISAARIADAVSQHGAINIGCRTGKLVGVDIDVWEAHPKFGAIEKAVRTVLGSTPLVRWGRKGCLLLYRTETPTAKRKLELGTFDYNPGGKRSDEQKERNRRQAIEMLGEGQQVVLYGVHPLTGKVYAWCVESWEQGGGPDPLTVKLEELPAVTPEKITEALAAVAQLMGVEHAPDEKPHEVSEARGEPVCAECVREVAEWATSDKQMPRERWRNAIAGVRAAPGLAVEELRAIALGVADPAYHDEVNTIFDTMPPKERGIGFGTLVHMAREAGWTGNLYAEPRPEWLERMNAKFAVVVHANKFRIALLDRAKIEFMQLDDFHNMHANRFVTVGEGDKAKPQPTSKVWLKHKDRREYLNPGVVFEPGSSDRHGALNLWRGWTVKPIKGDWSRLRSHLLNVVCRGDEDCFDYLIRYFALGVQEPGRPIQVALAFRGKPGAGKGIVVRTYGQLFGPHFRHYFRADQLVGQFNGNLGAACVVFLDEALFAANKQHEQILKALITEPTIEVEEKFLMPITVKNHLRVLISSNSDWVVPIDIDDRRFAVFDVAETYTPASSHKQYWDELHREVENGGQAAFLHDLLNMDLNGFDVRDIPNTDARSAQKRLSLSGPLRWLHDALSMDKIEGTYIDDQYEWKKNGLEIPMDEAHGGYCRASRRLYGEHHPVSREVWAKTVYETLGETLRKYRPSAGGSRRYMWGFASRDRCRAAFQANLKLTGKLWDDD